MKHIEEMKIIDLLIQFSRLERKEREWFLENVNRYIFVSPRRRQKLRLTWEAQVKTDPTRRSTFRRSPDFE